MSEVQQAVTRLLTPTSPTVQSAPASADLLYRATVRERRTAVDPETAEHIRACLAEAVASERPIEFANSFGGYKAWFQPCAPHVNWAEVMWLSYLRTFATRLASLHAPGVVICLNYYSHVIDQINGIPLSDQQVYLRELSELTRGFSCSQVRFELVDLAAEHGGPEEFLRDLRNALADYAQPIPARALDSARRNVRDPATVYASARLCTVMESLPQRRVYNKESHRIQIVHIGGSRRALHLGTSRASIHQPWVGEGFLRRTQTGELVEDIARQPPQPFERVAVQSWACEISPWLRTVAVL